MNESLVMKPLAEIRSEVDPRPADHPAVAPGHIGIALLNLGTPDATSYWPMRRYLSEFLSDRRVIDYSPWIWQPLLQTVILSKRPFTSGKAYDSIWNRELDESPLRTTTRSQAARLGESIARRFPQVSVDWGMRYGNPSTATTLQRLEQLGCRRLLLMALYPQYSAPTTATAYDKAFEALRTLRWQPAIRTLPSYHDHPGYIAALAESVEEHLAALPWEPELVLFSYHGMPKRYLELGDPYHCFCQKTTRLVREALRWPDARVRTVFQSRFGPEEWLGPYLDETLATLPSEGVRRVAVLSPAFVTDCLETLEEIEVEGREAFMEAGGEAFSYIPCLNDSDRHIALLEQLAVDELQGWL